MKIKGFTILELLTVIVILAIIALITVPIIFNIIESSRKSTLERTFEGIEKAAKNYVMDNMDGIVDYEVLIPIESLRNYINKMPEDASSEYVVVKNLGYEMQFFYTGRDKNPYDETPRLIDLIDEQEEYIAPEILVNGEIVNKVIGSKEQKEQMNNYVWYSGFLWQVLETNDTGVKMVLSHGIASLSYGETDDYQTSWVRKWLNDVSSDTDNFPNENDRIGTGIFYNALSRKDLLVDTRVCLDTVTNVVEDLNLIMDDDDRTRVTSFTPISNCQTAVFDKVTLMTLEDYVYAYDGTLGEYNHSSSSIVEVSKRKKGGLMGYNFIDADELTWLATPSNVSNYVWTIQHYDPGYISKDHGYVNADGRSVRPVITLKKDVRINRGDGTINNPYQISSSLSLSNGSDLSYTTIGEYLYISEANNPYETNQVTKENVRYRIIGKDELGIKVQRDDILKKLPETMSESNKYVPFYTYRDVNVNNGLWCYYERSIRFYYTGGCDENNYMKNVGNGEFELEKGNSIGYFLNEATNSFYSWISPTYQNIIKETEWKLPVAAFQSDVTKMKLLSSTNNSGLSYHYGDYDGEYHAKISLPSWGDILSGNDLNTGIWYMNRWPGSDSKIANVNSSGEAYDNDAPRMSRAIRPVFYLPDNIMINSGSGTKVEPYRLYIN